MMSHGEKHKAGWLLVVSQDKAVRGYAVAEGAHNAQPHDPEELQAVSSGKVGVVVWREPPSTPMALVQLCSTLATS